jgi:hypoxanthine-guanine phosphoribosyltransferase
VLLDKKARRKVEYVPDFVGFEVRTVRQAGM